MHCEHSTMSTGAPSFSVDSIPSNGHNYRQSRGRGHSRANRWAQPPPLSQPAEGHLHEHSEPINALNSSYSYGHAHHDSSHSHQTHSHSHSGAHHNHNHSVSSIHHDHHDQHDHDTEGSNGIYGIMSAETNIQADQSPEKMYVSWKLLEE